MIGRKLNLKKLLKRELMVLLRDSSVTNFETKPNIELHRSELRFDLLHHMKLLQKSCKSKKRVNSEDAMSVNPILRVPTNSRNFKNPIN